jgi:hypothetical protein
MDAGATAVYTATTVSKSLPLVFRLTALRLADEYLNHIDLPPAIPAWSGSPVSAVAWELFE